MTHTTTYVDGLSLVQFDAQAQPQITIDLAAGSEEIALLSPTFIDETSTAVVINAPHRATTFTVDTQASASQSFIHLSMIDEADDTFIQVFLTRLDHTIEDSLDIEVCYSYGTTYSQLQDLCESYPVVNSKGTCFVDFDPQLSGSLSATLEVPSSAQ